VGPYPSIAANNEKVSMDALIAAVAALAAARTREEITEIARTAARKLTGADGVTFVLRDGADCFYADEDAIAPLWKGKRFPLEKCISGWSMLNRKPVAIPDIYQDNRIPHDAYRRTFVRSLFMVPIGEGDAVAAIGAYWATVREPTHHEREMLLSLAKAAGLALRNVQLNAQVQSAVERERQARLEAERLNQQKDQFLATLSHELRTPLHVIRNWVWQLKKIGSADERVRKAAEVIERNATLQARLVEDLLDLSRAAAGKLKIDLQLVDLAAMCAAVIEVLQPNAREKNISVSFEKEHLPQVWADPDRVQQIVWNVVSNAVKFTPAGGRIEVKVTRGPRHACVIVKDTGIGVEANFLPQLFEPFMQADAGATRRFGGLGLGLSIVKNLVNLHNGSVRAESAGRDQGLTITIELPVPVISDQPGTWLKRRAGIEVSQGRLDGLTILIVDDEEDVLSALEGILTQAGGQVLKAKAVPEALALIQAHHPSVVLSDLAMPQIDGFALVKEIRNLPTPDASIPVAALSAYLASDYEAEAAQAGFETYIEKPVSPEELVGRVRHLAVSKRVH
jgi:signal transduction histidine kinase/ActR/RegA family two-component response regulator